VGSRCHIHDSQVGTMPAGRSQGGLLAQ